MDNFIHSLAKIGEPIRHATARAILSFSPLETRLFLILSGVALFTFIGILFQVNNYFSVEIPARGGTLKEGVIGAPRFINPLLALGEADRDLTALVYSGLMRGTLEGGLVPDLAESYSISEDGTTYTFILKNGLRWDDGVSLSSDDVVFTVTKAQDSILRSPKRASWEGVSVEKVDGKTIAFKLRQPYSPFLENTTLGILPRHIWEKVGSEQFGFSTYNVEPVGSGPYRVETIKKDSSGIPTYYGLVPFPQKGQKLAFIDTIEMHFFSNDETLFHALRAGEIGAANAIPTEKIESLETSKKQIKTFALPRVFGVFFNQNQNPLFTDKAIRNGLTTSIDREAIVNEILHGYGTALVGPFPPGNLTSFQSPETESPKEDAENKGISRIEDAQKILDSGGWKINNGTGIREKKVGKKTAIFEFTLVTSETEELKNAASLIKETWEKLGAKIILKTFVMNDLNQNIIRPRKYDALFFGEIIGRESDPYPFWHSSQRNDPGLNIALYANITVDKLLERGRGTSKTEERKEIYEQFQKEIAKDIPAVFVYSPDFLYVLPKKIRGIKTGMITVPSERFLNVSDWYIETDKVWKIFLDKANQ